MNRERLHRITVEAGKCGGRPCIRGQHIRVTDVLELLGAGASFYSGSYLGSREAEVAFRSDRPTTTRIVGKPKAMRVPRRPRPLA